MILNELAILAAYRDGGSLKSVAKLFGTSHGTVDRILIKMGEPKKPINWRPENFARKPKGPHRANIERNNKIIDLINGGATQSEVAGSVGITAALVSNVVRTYAPRKRERDLRSKRPWSYQEENGGARIFSADLETVACVGNSKDAKYICQIANAHHFGDEAKRSRFAELGGRAGIRARRLLREQEDAE